MHSQNWGEPRVALRIPFCLLFPHLMCFFKSIVTPPLSLARKVTLWVQVSLDLTVSRQPWGHLETQLYNCMDDYRIARTFWRNYSRKDEWVKKEKLTLFCSSYREQPGNCSFLYRELCSTSYCRWFCCPFQPFQHSTVDDSYIAGTYLQDSTVSTEAKLFLAFFLGTWQALGTTAVKK